MSPHHSDQMSQRSQVSGSLCNVVKALIVSGARPSKGQTMSPIELFWTAKNMYFHAVKSTAHPPFIGALGHNTDCIGNNNTHLQACCEAAFTNNQAHFIH